MQRCDAMSRSGTAPQGVPILVRFVGKLVVEVLPAALASVIGALLFAHYQFGPHAIPAMAGGRVAGSAPASAEMVQLVREEHAMLRDFLRAQRQEEEKRAAAADAADARAAAEAELAEAAMLRAAELPAAKSSAQHAKSTVAAASPVSISPPPAALPPIVVAGAQPLPPPMPQSLVGKTLAVPGHVVAATLRAVMTIGGIPSWIGHRLGDSVLYSRGSPSSASS